MRYTIACFALSLLVAAAITYGFERPVAGRLLRAWQAYREAKAKKGI